MEEMLSAAERRDKARQPRTPIWLDLSFGLQRCSDLGDALSLACHDLRAHRAEFQRLTFCLLGAGTAIGAVGKSAIAELGRRIELTDFGPEESPLLIERLLLAGANSGIGRAEAEKILERVLYWTSGHPYLTQRFCSAVCGSRENGFGNGSSCRLSEVIDSLCADLFLSPAAQESDHNLLYVRDRLLRSSSRWPDLLNLYLKVWQRHSIQDDSSDPLIELLRMSGIIRSVAGWIEVRNRIYSSVFDFEWIGEIVSRMLPQVETLADG